MTDDIHILMFPEEWDHDPDAQKLTVICKVTHVPGLPFIETFVELGDKRLAGGWELVDQPSDYVMEFKGKSAQVVWDYPDCHFELEVKDGVGKLSAWRMDQAGWRCLRRDMLTLQYCAT